MDRYNFHGDETEIFQGWKELQELKDEQLEDDEDLYLEIFGERE